MTCGKEMTMLKNRRLESPFFEVGPKNYLYGDSIVELALAADRASEKYNVDIIFTCPYVDIRRVDECTKNLYISAPHMDCLSIGRGIADVLPESIKAAGAKYVTLNHCEKRLPFNVLEKTAKRAREVGLGVIICADSLTEIKAVAYLSPDIIIAEPDELIGTGKGGDVSYVPKAVDAVREINKNIYVLIGAGIRNGQDVYDVVSAGSDASGTSSGIVNAADREKMMYEMVGAVRRAWDDRHNKQALVL